MRDDLLKILNYHTSDLRNSLGEPRKAIDKYNFNNIITDIMDYYNEVIEENYNQKIKNSELNAKVEMKDNLIGMYEKIISNSNFSVIIKDKEVKKK